jgi:hypothetical protein
MNPKHYYHTPVKPASTRVSCPVCHEPVYSRAGIHPQCAVIQSDPSKLKSKRPAAGGIVDPSIRAINAIDAPEADVVVEPPTVELIVPPLLTPAGRKDRRTPDRAP